MLSLDNEIWLPISGFEQLYEISNLGRVKALKKEWDSGVCIANKPEKILKPHINGGGYAHIKLWRPGARFKWYQVHQLVAIAFLQNLENKPHVNHINHNRLDNRVENLEWCTQKENMTHASNAGRLRGINGKMVINKNTRERFISCKEAAMASGINYQTLRSYLNGGLPNKSPFYYE